MPAPDMIFPEALETRDEFEKFAKAISAPLVANMTEFGKSPRSPPPNWARWDSPRSLPVTLFRVAMKGVEEALAELLASRRSGLPRPDADSRELYDVLGYRP
jgi:methylisocitrate lyase